MKGVIKYPMPHFARSFKGLRERYGVLGVER